MREGWEARIREGINAVREAWKARKGRDHMINERERERILFNAVQWRHKYLEEYANNKKIYI